MLNNISLFLFIISLIFILKKISDFLINLFKPDPQIMILSIYEKIIIYITLSYLITYILT